MRKSNYILIGVILLLISNYYLNSDYYYGAKNIEGYVKTSDPAMNAFYGLCLLGILIYRLSTEESPTLKKLGAYN